MSPVRTAVIVFLGFLLFVALSGFGLAFAAGRTILNPDFIIHRLDTLDVTSLVDDALRDQVPDEVLSIVPAEFIDEVLADVFTELEPWLREQVSEAVDTGYDYLLGRSENLSLAIDVEPVKELVRAKLLLALLASPPPGLEGIPPALLESLLNDFYEQVSGQIPSTLEINKDTLNELNPDILPALAQARRYVGYFQIAYRVLIVAIALLIMGIILLDRRLKGASRWLGIPCLVSGIASYVATFFIKHYAGALTAPLGLPAELQSWLPGLVNDSLAPLRTYGIILMVVGTALLIVSFAYKRRDDAY